MTQKITLFLLASFLLASQAALCQWVETTNIDPSFYNSALAWDGKVYFAGGIQNIITASDKMHILDLETKQLTEMTLSAGRGGMMSVAHEGKLYFAGGYKWINNGTAYEVFPNIDIYDTETQQFSSINLTVPRAAGTAVALGDKILFAGGYVFNGTTLVASDVVEIYDTSTGLLITEHLSQPRGDLGGAAVAGKAYFCAGAVDVLAGLSSNRVDVFDGTTWTTDTVSVARHAPSVVAVGQYLLVAGGASSVENKYDIVDIFNTQTNAWTQATLSAPRCYMAAATIGNKAYFTGGGNCNAATFFLDESTILVDFFDAETGQMGIAPPLNTNRIAHACAAWGDKIAVGAGWRPEQEGFTGSVEVYTDSTFVNAVREAIELPFVLSPNPATQQLRLQFPDDFQLPRGTEAILSDLTGRTRLRLPLSGNSAVLDLSNLATGLYWLEVRSDTGRAVQKIVVR